ncbi:integrase [Rathayibacter tritici]|uniref:Integrase n=1 Tax=Rathayibacter tritici TaxID=33888 RepID=A0A160KTF6_9MICO|nr:integrase [Rathayibacter tritici]
MIEQAIRVRASLEQSGLDHGPISVHDRMVQLGLAAPSRAALARAFQASVSDGVCKEWAS